MSLTTRHSTRVHTGRQLEREWPRLLDELARRGVLGCLGAADALLAAGSSPGRPDERATAPAPHERKAPGHGWSRA